ncbi:hypothetical protein C2S51_015241 [Perilla frutescens var. frutescens]|nr:hypothetical protein C2S51_015241 [Perilla frutescens var. frutescens]
MDAQPQKRNTNNPYIPVEIVEEILFNLPLKSLLRFSSVSKSWNSMIFESGFIKRFRSRAAASRERIVLGESVFEGCSTRLLSSISSNNHPSADETDFVCPFGNHPNLTALAFSDEFWLARAGKSLLLWNPSMRKHMNLPTPSFMRKRPNDFVFGLGYDPVGDDYKILKIPRADAMHHPHYRAELYSLRSDSWKNIKNFSTDIDVGSKRGVFVSGKLHWMSSSRAAINIISFNLSTEKFGEVAQPNYSLINRDAVVEEVSVLRGMLCLGLREGIWFDIWVMEEYGVAKSWTKKFGFNSISGSPFHDPWPLYFSENGEIIARVIDGWEDTKISVYKLNKKTAVLQEITGFFFDKDFVYVDSLVAPAMWRRRLPSSKIATGR